MSYIEEINYISPSAQLIKKEKSSYNELNDKFMNLWNSWYDAASTHQSDAKHQAKKLLNFLQGSEGKKLIQETKQRIDDKHIYIPGLKSFEQQLHSSIGSLKIFIHHSSVVPQAASQYLARMQSYMYQCRDKDS